MTERQLRAIIAAIIFAGADSSESSAGYSTTTAVELAEKILARIDSADEAAREHQRKSESD